MDRLGEHILVEYYDCDAAILDSRPDIERMMLKAADIAGATIIDHKFHQFAPQGVSGAVIIAESHLTIHTWPEHRYAAFDLFTCGCSLDALKCTQFMKKSLKATQMEETKIDRGTNAFR